MSEKNIQTYHDINKNKRVCILHYVYFSLTTSAIIFTQVDHSFRTKASNVNIVVYAVSYKTDEICRSPLEPSFY